MFLLNGFRSTNFLEFHLILDVLDDINESWNDEGIHFTGMEEIV